MVYGQMATYGLCRLMTMFAVSPLLTPWRGDQRRNPDPYFIAESLSGASLDYCNHVARILRSRGIRCFVEVVSKD